MNMRKIITSLALAASVVAMAQVSNGSFESSTDGWSQESGVNIQLFPASQTQSAPVECGTNSLMVTEGSVGSRAFAAVGGIQSGDSIRYSAWVYPVGTVLPQQHSGIRLGRRNGSTINNWSISEVAPNLSANTWLYIEGTMAIDLQPGDTLLIFLQVAAEAPNVQVIFDEVNVEVIPEFEMFSHAHLMTLEESTTSVDEAEAMKTKAWPNPASDQLNVSATERPISALAILSDGRTVSLQPQWANGLCRLDVSSLPSGTATIRMINRGGSVSTKAIISH